MKIVRKIEFTGKNLNDVFRLPCVKTIMKIGAEPVIILSAVKTRESTVCNVGDTLVQYTDGKWDIEKKE